MNAPLTPEERERLEDLFDRAAELPQEEHAAFLDRECPDQDRLRTELVRLLQGLAGDDLVGARQPGAPLPPGTRIGPYELQERIGEGGMGEVYAAHQQEPVTRRVALKVIKPGMDSAQVIARFEAERQALARMTHPHVAQVYDGGVTDDGRPYFVMELVDGLPITEYCDQHKLTTRERLELLQDVCEGVQHAHQKGIIHRDLKPSNLLVTRLEDRVIPKIIDFGVARATTGSLAERTLHTMAGQVVGTLDYMSPEQADPSGLDVDTRSDVYSLGVVLYQLASGLLPFDHGSVVDRPLSEVQRAIREQDPPTPSTRLRRQTATANAVAPLHSTDHHSLIRQLSGDLDWICLKALEKDPERRYQSAADLAEDLRRHLADELVLAGRPSAWYRARKFGRRHKVGVMAGVLVLAALATGMAGVLSGKQRAEARNLELLQLSASRDLEGLEQEAEILYPPYPDRIQDMQDWMGRARELVARLPGLRDTLKSLRQRAQNAPASDNELLPDAGAGAQAAERELLEELLENMRVSHEGRSPEDLEQLDAAVEFERVQDKLAGMTERAWEFDDPDDQWQHDVLAPLIARLERFEADLLGAEVVSDGYGWSMPLRLERARHLQEGFAPEGRYRRMWEEHLPDMRACYEAWDESLDLSVQMGLVPLWHDEDSDLWHFAHLLSADPDTWELPRRGEDGRIQNRNTMGLVLVLIPGGSFVMGAQGSDRNAPYYDPGVKRSLPREAPPHPRTLPAFFLSRFEMTQAQWLRCRRSNPSVPPEEGNDGHDLPVDQVTWIQCVAVTRQLGLALPPETWWEYAARGGSPDHTPWWTGHEVDSLDGAANIWDRGSADDDEENGRAVWIETPFIQSDFDDHHRGKSPVGFYRPNDFGLHDIHGNVSEWCANSPFTYGFGPKMASRLENLTRLPFFSRVARGGSNRRTGHAARLSHRSAGTKELALPDVGLRPALAIDSDEDQPHD